MFASAAAVAAAKFLAGAAAHQMNIPAATDAEEIQLETGFAPGLFEYPEERFEEVEIDHALGPDLVA